MKINKGISLIVLVITIIVIIILAGAVILSLSNNNPISSATQAKFKSNVEAYNSELAMSISKQYADDFTFNPTTLYATTWNGNTSVTSGTVKYYITSMTAADGAKYGIVAGKLVYVGTPLDEKQWVTDIGITSCSVNLLYTGAVQTFVAPITGTYTLEVWGASGGGDANQLNGSHKGLGGYSKGNISLTIGQKIYIYIGGQGIASTTVFSTGGGWNGGGNGASNINGCLGYGGGGATDIRTVNGLWDDSTSLISRIIVAGGGGGSDNLAGPAGGIDDGSGGGGGGLYGENAKSDGVYVVGTGATQEVGTLGKGQDTIALTDTGGGGGGYRGGLATNYGNGGAGGGSGFIGGVTSAITQNGINDGNGYVKITLL